MKFWDLFSYLEYTKYSWNKREIHSMAVHRIIRTSSRAPSGPRSKMCNKTYGFWNSWRVNICCPYLLTPRQSLYLSSLNWFQFVMIFRFRRVPQSTIFREKKQFTEPATIDRTTFTICLLDYSPELSPHCSEPGRNLFNMYVLLALWLVRAGHRYACRSSFWTSLCVPC